MEKEKAVVQSIPFMKKLIITIPALVIGLVFGLWLGTNRFKIEHTQGIDIWFYAFWGAYVAFILVVWKAYLSKIYKLLRNRQTYLHYHVLDTGEYGEMVFDDTKVEIAGQPHTWTRDAVFMGTLFFKSDEVPAVKVERDIKRYVYFCFSKEWDTVRKQDVLETLLIFATKHQLITMILIGILMTIIAGVVVVASGYIWHGDTMTAIQNINQTVQELKK